MEPNEFVEGFEYSWYLLKSMLISFYLFDCISYMYHVLVMKDNTHIYRERKKEIDYFHTKKEQIVF